MDGSRYALVTVALLCVLTLGTSATTLESTVTTDPADEIDIDWDRVPIDQSSAADIRDDIEGESSGEPDAGETSPDGDSETPVQRSAGTSPAADGSGGSGQAGALPTLWDRLFALLADLLRVLIPIGTLLLFALLAYRFRNRLLDRFRRDSPGDGSAMSRGSRWPDGEPSSAVDRAWVAMVRGAGLERPETMTPAECAAAARESGLDEEAVELITSAFERVHYGGSPPDEFAESAREGLRRLGGRPETNGAAPVASATREGQR